MNELQIFNDVEFGEIRMVMVGGKPHAVGVDVARALEYANPGKAVIDHCKGISKLGIPSRGGVQETNVIAQGDILRLIIKAAEQSKNENIKAKAEKFESWIFDEVIPAVLETGQYVAKHTPADTPIAQRAEASLLNAKSRAAKLLYEIAKNSTNDLYRQAGEAIAMNMLAGSKVIDMPKADQRPNHELSYFCKFIGKNENWRSVLGKKLKAAGYKQVPENGVMKVSMDKGHNQRDTFYWYDDVILPILKNMFPEDYNGGD